MKIVNVKHLEGSDREVHCPNGGFVSRRLLLANDGMGYSMHHTTIPPNGWQHWHYKNHMEACYCISGRGRLKDLATGEVVEIVPGVVYALDKHDDHEFMAEEVTVLLCVFNPPVTGTEVHREDGSYALPTEEK